MLVWMPFDGLPSGVVSPVLSSKRHRFVGVGDMFSRGGRCHGRDQGMAECKKMHCKGPTANDDLGDVRTLAMQFPSHVA